MIDSFRFEFTRYSAVLKICCKKKEKISDYQVGGSEQLNIC